MTSSANAKVQVVMPVHNEATSIEATIMEICQELSPQVDVQFVICEDGSTDGTKEILMDLSKRVPMKLIMSDERKGYSSAVIDGFKATEAAFVLFLDSDGQCCPSDFWQFWERRTQYDVVVGWRVTRADPLFRQLMSRAFKLVYRALFHVPAHDPSCPYLLIHQRVLVELTPELGVLEQGFWWEFLARVHRRGFKLTEVPIEHRRRQAGSSLIYKPHKLPRIGISHLAGLLKIWRETA